MSHSSTTIVSTTQPLSDILPWGNPISASSGHGTSNRTLLVTDACSTDGRFLLHTLALQFLSSRYSVGTSAIEGAVLWVSVVAVSERQIIMGLRKGLQHNLGSCAGGKSSNGMTPFGQGGIGNSNGRIHIVLVPIELAEAALEQENDVSIFSRELYLKRLHKRIVHWLNHRELLAMHQPRQREPNNCEGATFGPNLVIMDNATMLGTLFGARLTNAFLSSVRSSLEKHAKRCSLPSSNIGTTKGTANFSVTQLLAIRASSPDDGGLYQIDTHGHMKGEKLRSEYSRLLRPWLGFGSGMISIGSNDAWAGTDILQTEELSNYLSISSHSRPSILYMCGLYEIADGVVDVSPLESGYSRDVLGRLSFATSWSGKGWWGNTCCSSGSIPEKEDINGTYSSICVNYRCDDTGVRIMRLRT